MKKIEIFETIPYSSTKEIHASNATRDEHQKYVLIVKNLLTPMSCQRENKIHLDVTIIW